MRAFGPLSIPTRSLSSDLTSTSRWRSVRIALGSFVHPTAYLHVDIELVVVVIVILDFIDVFALSILVVIVVVSPA